MAIPVLGILASAIPFIDELFESEEEKTAAKLKVMQLAEQGKLAQVAVNIEDAKSDNWFQSGWRPSIGWACSAAFGITFVLTPLIHTGAFYYAQFAGVELDLSALPTFDLATMMPVLLGMLGLGGLRTFERLNGKEKN